MYGPGYQVDADVATATPSGINPVIVAVPAVLAVGIAGALVVARRRGLA